ncbi:TonB-dependent vitamin B12 receptor BtuB [Leclercia sp. UBA1284]|uniref:TonB-dependent vitamin B12 receptor BtuB n=1 Tax=Leclercia sp. UBA1284 TaxID=1946737 RepID=UPI00257D9194|nr:TonB-dependent vitamin B12 receptor BtuB [Leclercia sp. UBA1284]
MIKKISLCTALSVTAFSGWAQDNASTMVVTANRFEQPVNSVLASTDIVTREDINRWQSKDLIDVMRRLPGVQIAQNGGMGQSSYVYIRGAEARHTLVLIDGIPLAKSGITGISDFSQLPLSLVQRIELIRGPRSAVYGADAIGGVVNIITQNSQPGGKVQASMGSHHYQQYDATVRQQLGEATLATIAGSFTETQGFNVQPTSTYSGDRDDDGFRNKTFWAGLNHNFTQEISGFVRGYGYSNNTAYDAGYAGGSDKRQVYNHTYETGLAWSHDNYSTQLTGSYQKYKDYNYSSVSGMYNAGTSLDNMTQKNVQWGNSLAVGYGTVSAGIDWQQQKLTSEDLSNSDDYKRDNTGYYLTAQQKLDTVTLEGSVRGDDNEQFGWNGTWQTAAGWEFVPDYQLTVSYGTGFQAPTLGQMYGQSRLFITSNPDLKAEKSGQFEVGVQGLTGPVNWRLAAYQNKIKDLIDYYSPDFGFTGTYFNTQSATIKGVELSGDFETGPVTHRLSAEYLDPRRDSDNEVLAHRSRQQYKYQLDWAMFGFDMDLSYQYFGKSYNNNSNQFSSVQRRMPSYSLLDLSASYPVTSHLTVRGKIANLFDKDYETVYGYQTAGREYTLSGSYTF